MFKRNTVIGLTLASVLMAGTMNSALAEDNQHAEKSGRLQKELNLTDAQKTQVQEIMKSQQVKAQAIRDQAKALREETRAKLSAVLTPEQMAKYDAMKEKRMKKKHKKGPQGTKAN